MAAESVHLSGLPLIAEMLHGNPDILFFLLKFGEKRVLLAFSTQVDGLENLYICIPFEEMPDDRGAF